MDFNEFASKCVQDYGSAATFDFNSNIADEDDMVICPECGEPICREDYEASLHSGESADGDCPVCFFNVIHGE